MKSFICALFLAKIISASLIAQDSAVIFMNRDFEAVNDVKTAVIKRHALIKNNRYYIFDQFVDGRKIMQGEYNSVDPWTEDGPFVFYDQKGRKYAEGNFVNGSMDGQWVYYDSTITDTVVYRKEWTDYIKGGALYKYPGNFKMPDENFYEFVLPKIHFPPRYIFDCIPRHEMFHVAISKIKEINIKPYYNKLESDFSMELYRVLNEAPSSLFYEESKKANRYYTASINFSCPSGTDPAKVNPCNGPVYVFVEEQATFQGGTIENFRQWVQMTMIYPPKSVENSESGRITFQFLVTSTGMVDCVKILRSSGYPLLDQEAVRVISGSPKWLPAKQSGQTVSQQFVMPVIFQLQ